MKFFAKLIEKIAPHYFWYALGTVFLLYLASFLLDYFSFSYWPGILSQAAATIIAGGVFASLLKSYQYSELFKGELETLFADDKFVKQMKNIARHGQDGSQTLLNTFAHLATQSSADLGSRVEASFPALLKVKTDYTFRNYKRYIKIKAYAKTKGIITIVDEVQYEIDAHLDAIYKSVAGGVAFTSQPIVNEYTLTEINGPRVDLSNNQQWVNNTMTVEVPITQGKRYRLHRSLEFNYQLAKDPNIHQQLCRFTDGFDLEVDNQVASEIDFSLSWINFEVQPAADRPTGQGGAVCRYTQHGLTFPLQGFILTLSPNK